MSSELPCVFYLYKIDTHIRELPRILRAAPLQGPHLKQNQIPPYILYTQNRYKHHWASSYIDTQTFYGECCLSWGDRRTDITVEEVFSFTVLSNKKGGRYELPPNI